MGKNIVSLAIIEVFFLFILTSIPRNESIIQAQVKTTEIPKPEIKDSLTDEEKLIIQKVTSLADKIADVVKEKEPKWKIKKKVSGRTSRSFDPSDNRVKEIFSTNAYLQFNKSSGQIDIKLIVKSPSSFEEVSKSLNHSLKLISRGTINRVTDIGDECVFITDFPGTPSTSVNLHFIKDKILIGVGVRNKSKKREVNVEEAKKIARIIESVIETPVED